MGLQVECVRCGILQSWSTLQDGDGICPSCSSARLGSAASHNAASETSGDGVPEDLFVECGKCGTSHSWSVLALGDGLCSRCFEEKEELACNAVVISTSQSSSSNCGFSQPSQLNDSAGDQLPLLSSTPVHNQAFTEVKVEHPSDATIGSWRARRRAKAS